MKPIKPLIFVATLLASCVSTAAIDANGYFSLGYYKIIKNDIKTKEVVSSYITGLGRGIIWSNYTNVTEKQKPLFCLPEGVSINAKLIRQLLDEEVKTPHPGTNYDSSTPLGVILLNSFWVRFPCTN